MNSVQQRIPICLISIGLLASLTLTQLRGAHALDARQLSFYHTHTTESLDIVYFENGEYVDSALEEINGFLADFRTGDVAPIDPKLLDLIYDIRETLGSNGTYQVISAYRSRKTNELLRASGAGVARNSQHILGKAIDVRLDDTSIEALRDTALTMQRGGVGFYKESDFVHVDTGRVRRW
jgi:uncharacterized protein YcbK (DUF882 family)